MQTRILIVFRQLHLPIILLNNWRMSSFQPGDIDDEQLHVSPQISPIINQPQMHEEQFEEGFHFKADHIKATKVYYRKNKHKKLPT